MEINIEKLKIEINQLNKLINDYEDTYLNLYNELSNCSLFWQDNNSPNFFNSISKEKIEVKTTIDELNDISAIYNYIIEKYNTIGNRISYNLEIKDKITTRLNNCITKTHNIYNNYKNLDLSFCPTEAKYLYNQKEQLNQIENNLNEVKEKIKNYFISIEEIEKEVNLKITKLTITTIKENNINNYI